MSGSGEATGAQGSQSLVGKTDEWIHNDHTMRAAARRDSQEPCWFPGGASLSDWWTGGLGTGESSGLRPPLISDLSWNLLWTISALYLIPSLTTPLLHHFSSGNAWRRKIKAGWCPEKKPGQPEKVRARSRRKMVEKWALRFTEEGLLKGKADPQCKWREGK